MLEHQPMEAGCGHRRSDQERSKPQGSKVCRLVAMFQLWHYWQSGVYFRDSEGEGKSPGLEQY